MSEVQPAVSVLTPAQFDEIHHCSLKILAEIGIRVDSPRARELLVAAGCHLNDDRIVRIPAGLVARALTTAPATVDIHDRTGTLRFQLGNARSRSTRFGIGVTNLYYQDPQTDAVTAFTREHMQLATRLGSALAGFDVIATSGILQDVEPQAADLYGALEMIANTTKPLVLLISEKNSFDISLDMLEHLHGDLAAKPFIIPYFNPITPLVLNEDTSDNIFSTVARGLPFIYSNYGMSGATTPITPAGNLALLNAELLAGLVFSQLIRAGTPIILGSLPAGFDMQRMASIYTPLTMLLNIACAEMMAYYGLPHAGTSGSGPGWGADLPASGTLWMNHLTSCLGKVGLAPFVGGNFDSLVFSPALVVFSNEVIRQARMFAQGFVIDETTLALEEIVSMGPGGSFLISEQTVKLCRTMNFAGSIWPNLTFDQWRAKGRPKADDILRRYTCHLMDNLDAPEDHAELVSRGETFIRQRQIK